MKFNTAHTRSHWFRMASVGALLGLGLQAAAFAATPTASNSIALGKTMLPGQKLVSTQCGYHFDFQSGDGNLVTYSSTGAVVWASGTSNKAGARLVLQGDSNLVQYNTSNKAIWASNTVGKGAAYLILEDDGRLMLKTQSGSTVWSAGTAKPCSDTGGGTGGGTGGTTPTARVAFVGDSGYGSNFQSVLNLIKAEGAGMTMFLGDTAYTSGGDTKWDAMVRNTLGPNDPVILTVGNHDVLDSDFNTVRSLAQARLNNQSNVKCTGTYAERMTCTYKNVYFVITSVGTTGSNSDREAFLADRLNNAPAGAWRICAWHKNQRQMQVGGKTDETGWTSYSTCRQKGGIVATGHEHSYSRTHLLSSMSNQTVASTTSPYTVTEGRTIAFVSGLGGVGIRDQEIGGAHWAKVYTSSQGATYGVLFGDFYADRAEFYFKNIKGQIIDKFTVLKGY